MHGRHVCIEIFDFVMHTFVRATTNYKRTEHRMKGSGFLPAANERLLMITPPCVPFGTHGGVRRRIEYSLLGFAVCNKMIFMLVIKLVS